MYINGLRYEIQDEIRLLNQETVEDAYQAASRVEEKLLRKQNQKNRGRSTTRGKGSPNKGGKFQTPKDEVEGSSIQVIQRGEFRGGRRRGKNREVKCYTYGEIGHMSWECPRNKPTTQRTANIAEAREESSEEEEVNNPLEEGESLMLK